MDAYRPRSGLQMLRLQMDALLHRQANDGGSASAAR